MDPAVGAPSDRRKRAIARASIEAERAEEEVRQSENRLRLVIGTIPTMAWSLLPDGAVDFVNQRWLEYTGLSLEEARSEEHTSELQSHLNLVCRLLLEKKKNDRN